MQHRTQNIITTNNNNTITCIYLAPSPKYM